MSLKNNTQKVQLQNASNIKGQTDATTLLYAASCCIFSEPNWNKSILLALHVFQARLWCIRLGNLCMMQGNRAFPRDRFREKILGNRWFCDLSLWVLNLDLGNTNLFRHKNLYKFYIQIEREGEQKMFSAYYPYRTTRSAQVLCFVAWFAPALEAWIHGTENQMIFF